MAPKPPKKSSKRKKAPLSAAERAQRRLQAAHKRDGRVAFIGTGFKRLNSVVDTAFTYEGTKSDFDDIFILENVLVLCEYTVLKESGISDHIKKKKVLYDKIMADTGAFLSFLRSSFPLAATSITSPIYQDHHYKVLIVYCSLNTVKGTLKAEVPSVIYFDYNKIQYFKSLVSTIKISARSELLAFLRVDYNDFGLRIVKPSASGPSPYKGSVLPDAQSGFPTGYKIVSFYADAEALLDHSYVLRKDGWRDGEMLYQRMVTRSKIESMRRYLTSEKRVFVNNIIATLPHDTILKDQNGNDVTSAKLAKAEAVEVQIPARYNCVGLVDGQHRVLSYYEGGSHEAEISPLRQLQNLLVTGIVYPQGLTDSEQIRFEAGLFLEINSNQAGAKPELKQSIALLLTPFDNGSIAREVVNRLNDISSSVGGEFEKYFYDKGKIKIASIVSFGVKPLVKLSGSDSAYSVWADPDKSTLENASDDSARIRYVNFSAGLIDRVLGAIKSQVEPALWTRDRKVPGRLLTTTTINGAVALLRLLIENNHPLDFTYLSSKMKGLDGSMFNNYKSSQYNRLGRDLFSKFFS